MVMIKIKSAFLDYACENKMGDCYELQDCGG